MSVMSQPTISKHIDELAKELGLDRKRAGKYGLNRLLGMIEDRAWTGYRRDTRCARIILQITKLQAELEALQESQHGPMARQTKQPRGEDSQSIERRLELASKRRMA